MKDKDLQEKIAKTAKDWRQPSAGLRHADTPTPPFPGR